MKATARKGAIYDVRLFLSVLSLPYFYLDSALWGGENADGCTMARAPSRFLQPYPQRKNHLAYHPHRRETMNCKSE